MLQKICGPDSLANVVIVTTMWDMVTPEEGLRREQELRSSDSMFKFLLDGGANMMRHDGTHKSAADVVKYLLGKSTTTIQIVREIVHENKALEDTAAATELRKDIHALLMKHKNEMKSLDADLKGSIMQSEIAEERQILDLAITKLSEQLEELKRGISGTTGEWVSLKNVYMTILIVGVNPAILHQAMTYATASLLLMQRVLRTIQTFFS